MRLVVKMTLAFLLLTLFGLAQTLITVPEKTTLKPGLNIAVTNSASTEFRGYVAGISSVLENWENTNPSVKKTCVQIAMLESDRYPGHVLIRIQQNLGTIEIVGKTARVTDEIKRKTGLYVSPRRHSPTQAAELIIRRLNAMLSPKRALTTTSH